MPSLKLDLEKSFRRGNGTCLRQLLTYEKNWDDFEVLVTQYRTNYTLMVNEIKETCKKKIKIKETCKKYRKRTVQHSALPCSTVQ